MVLVKVPLVPLALIWLLPNEIIEAPPVASTPVPLPPMVDAPTLKCVPADEAVMPTTKLSMMLELLDGEIGRARGGTNSDSAVLGDDALAHGPGDRTGAFKINSESSGGGVGRKFVAIENDRCDHPAAGINLYRVVVVVVKQRIRNLQQTPAAGRGKVEFHFQ